MSEWLNDVLRLVAVIAGCCFSLLLLLPGGLQAEAFHGTVWDGGSWCIPLPRDFAPESSCLPKGFDVAVGDPIFGDLTLTNHGLSGTMSVNIGDRTLIGTVSGHVFMSSGERYYIAQAGDISSGATFGITTFNFTPVCLLDVACSISDAGGDGWGLASLSILNPFGTIFEVRGGHLDPASESGHGSGAAPFYLNAIAYSGAPVATPEPATWVSMLSGLAAIRFLLRRR